MLEKHRQCECTDNDSPVDCQTCDNTGYVTVQVDENQIVYVNVYSITREFGGHEEGGWYYNNFECLEVYPVRNKNSDLIKEELEKHYATYKYGNIYSVLGGRDIQVSIEERPSQSETKEVPHYE